ncbi:uncharacterized protein LOC129922866 [Biomphalaria glabrata]|uniref:Uncharacterized protein LOC129922866 n=1 Tax=Biomphalaria glabrata TaxID=6526 RepID=A0A9W2YVK7_BIOGL|nr:uncharacterized protein LOC129922866 [Biomphalaria glabrata]
MLTMNRIYKIIVLISKLVVFLAQEDILICYDTEEGDISILSVTWKPKQIINARLLINHNSKLISLCERHPINCQKILDNVAVTIIKIDHEEYNITVFFSNANSSGNWSIEYDYGFFKPAPEPCQFKVYSKSFIEMKDCPREIEEGETVNCSCKLKNSKSANVLYSWLNLSNDITELISNNSDLIFVVDNPLQVFLCVAEDVQAEKNYTENYRIRLKPKRHISLFNCPATILDQLSLVNCSYIYRPSTNYFESICDVWYSISDNTMRLAYANTVCSIEFICPVETSMRGTLIQVCSRTTYISNSSVATMALRGSLLQVYD